MTTPGVPSYGRGNPWLLQGFFHMAGATHDYTRGSFIWQGQPMTTPGFYVSNLLRTSATDSSFIVRGYNMITLGLPYD